MGIVNYNFIKRSKSCLLTCNSNDITFCLWANWAMIKCICLNFEKTQVVWLLTTKCVFELLVTNYDRTLAK